MKLPKFLYRFLQIKYWGVAWEHELPPEFIITKHALDRIDQRVSFSSALTHEQWVTMAWWYGKRVTREGAKSNKGQFSRDFHQVVYKEYDSYIFVFGLYYQRKTINSQKYLVTVLHAA